MHATYMPPFSDPHKMRDRSRARNDTASREQPEPAQNEPRPASPEADYGGMLSPQFTPSAFPKLMAKAGLYPATLDDLEEPAARLDGHDELSRGATVLGAYLGRIACPTTGEAIQHFEVLMAVARLSEDDLLLAMNELIGREVIRAWACSGRNIVWCAFEINDDDYYGDDANLPPDFALPVCGADEYEYGIGDDEVPLADEDPKRHRIFLKTKYRCFYCIEAWAAHIDHMHPRIRGGSNKDNNLIGACRTCNIQKKDRTVEEYRHYLSHRRRLPSIAHVRFYGEPAQ